MSGARHGRRSARTVALVASLAASLVVVVGCGSRSGEPDWVPEAERALVGQVDGTIAEGLPDADAPPLSNNGRVPCRLEDGAEGRHVQYQRNVELRRPDDADRLLDGARDLWSTWGWPVVDEPPVNGVGAVRTTTDLTTVAVTVDAGRNLARVGGHTRCWG